MYIYIYTHTHTDLSRLLYVLLKERKKALNIIVPCFSTSHVTAWLKEDVKMASPQTKDDRLIKCGAHRYHCHMQMQNEIQ